jgi:hypothetical protein
MAKRTTAYADNKGRLHATANAATLSDLACILGKIGDGDSLAPGIATLLLEKRSEIERIFAEHDAMGED